MAKQTLRYCQQMRFTGEQWGGLRKTASWFRVTGRQKAQRKINQLFMAYFGIIDDPLSSATMKALIGARKRETGECS